MIVHFCVATPWSPEGACSGPCFILNASLMEEVFAQDLTMQVHPFVNTISCPVPFAEKQHQGIMIPLACSTLVF